MAAPMPGCLLPLTLFHPFPKEFAKLLKGRKCFIQSVSQKPSHYHIRIKSLEKHYFFPCQSKLRADKTRHAAKCFLGQGLKTYMSTQPWSPLISMALTCSPAEMYISTAALGSLIFLAQSACLVISIFVSLGSPDPRKS